MAEIDAVRRLSPLDWAALVLLIIGGLNWGLVGLFDFNLVEALLRGSGDEPSLLERIVYILVGLSALYTAAMAPKFRKD